MKSLALVFLIIFQPSPPSPALSISGPTVFAEHALAVYEVAGATSVSWIIFPIGSGSAYSSSDGKFVVTAPPGQYQLLAAIESSNKVPQLATLSVMVTPASSQKAALVPVSSNPLPYSDMSNEIHRILSSSPDKSKVIPDAKILSTLYSFCASKIELDGFRPEPGLKSISQATLLVKSEERAMLEATPLKSLKDVYPDISKLAGEKFSQYILKYGDTFSVESRKAYIDFLRALANGFERVSGIQ